MTKNFKLYSQYYDLLYQDKDYEKEAFYIHNLIQSYAPKTKKILELGSGTGKHAKLFSNLGYSILGIEQSAEMAEIARKSAGNNTSFLIEDISVFRVKDKFDTALSLFHVISYLTESSTLIRTFENVNNHLKQGGIFIFDVWHSPAVYHQVPQKREKKLSNKVIEVSRKASPVINTETNIVEVIYYIEVKSKVTGEILKLTETHPMRHFSKPEIELLAYATGFEILHSEEFLSKTEPSKETWGVCYALKKNKDV
ncbi:class I SAM-dependent methyltransferase [Pedobacter miscanthi]|uniref:class I SAM-dependent DNA methyltransferase n=1 Tax=Pedobacter miscanthi TaxID=2259170 RepID=UPI00292D2223|nr:class I SAM-dependent methyltransferase [Pedobacter miscanthi]